ncbi:MAG TPA: PKD domain-containing protein [Bacteroidia bacterium]|nr:PKD domain-containing protein [Bacteroidia bacterium]
MQSKKENLYLMTVIIANLTLGIIPGNSQPYQWAKSMGGQGYDAANAMAVDGSGNVYTTGVFQDTVDFDPDAGSYNLEGTGFDNVFISKLNSNGNFVWAKRIGGSTGIIAYDIKTDAAGNVFTTGFLQDTVDFDPGPGVYNLVSTFGSDDIFVSKLNSSGSFIWARKMGGGNFEYGQAITTDNTGNVLTTGNFGGAADFDPGVMTHNLYSAGSDDVFISKLNSSGNYLWAKRIGGPKGDNGSSIITDAGGNVYTTGIFGGDTVDFNPGAGTYNLISPGGLSAFISKLSSNGNFVWAKNISGTGSVFGNAITLDVSGNIYLTGQFTDTADFDPGPGVYTMMAEGFYDSFILKSDSNGSFTWAKRMASAHGHSIFVDTSGNVYTTGSFSGISDFDPGPGIYNLTAAGTNDIFISKLDANGNFIWARNMGGSGSNTGGNGIFADAGGNVYIAGGFLDTVDFNPPLQANLFSNGYDDSFVAKYSQPGGCQAHFSIYADTIPHNWIVLNQSSGVWPVSYLWSWGDSTNSTGVAPSHIYNNPSYYNVCLNITDATGCISTYCDSSTYIFKGTSDNTMITINVFPTNIANQNPDESGNIIFPNPSNGDFTIHPGKQYDHVVVKMLNVTGQEVFNAAYFKTNMLNVSFKGEAGVYFVEMWSAEGEVRRAKVVIR